MALANLPFAKEIPDAEALRNRLVQINKEGKLIRSLLRAANFCEREIARDTAERRKVAKVG